MVRINFDPLVKLCGLVLFMAFLIGVFSMDKLASQAIGAHGASVPVPAATPEIAIKLTETVVDLKIQEMKSQATAVAEATQTTREQAHRLAVVASAHEQNDLELDQWLNRLMLGGVGLLMVLLFFSGCVVLLNALRTLSREGGVERAREIDPKRRTASGQAQDHGMHTPVSQPTRRSQPEAPSPQRGVQPAQTTPAPIADEASPPSSPPIRTRGTPYVDRPRKIGDVPRNDRQRHADSAVNRGPSSHAPHVVSSTYEHEDEDEKNAPQVAECHIEPMPQK